MHMEPYACKIQSKCQLTKDLCYHEALWVLSLFGVTLDSILYIVAIQSLSLEVCVCVLVVCLPKFKPVEGL